MERSGLLFCCLIQAVIMALLLLALLFHAVELHPYPGNLMPYPGAPERRNDGRHPRCLIHRNENTERRSPMRPLFALILLLVAVAPLGVFAAEPQKATLYISGSNGRGRPGFAPEDGAERPALLLSHTGRHNGSAAAGLAVPCCRAASLSWKSDA